MARILELIAGEGVNVLAFAGFSQGDEATLTFVPDDAKKATAVLKAQGIEFKSLPILVVKGASGAGDGARIARKLADAGINLESTYASTTGTGESIVVFRAADVEEASRVLA